MRSRPLRAVLLHAFLLVAAITWLFPMLWALFNSFRDYGYTLEHGYFSFGGFTLQNWTSAWDRGGFDTTMVNSAIITITAVILTLALASAAAFVLSRFSTRFNVAMLAFFVAANLLPPQALLVPIYRMFRAVPLPQWLAESGSLLDTHAGLILVHVAFQTGFCTFVLSNYMKAIPKEIYEAADVDGASIWTQFAGITIPLCRTPLAALATLQIAWIYNEFFWATVLMQTGSKFPVTSSLNNLKGAFFTDYNLLSAGSILAGLPVLIIFFVLQRQFVSGMTMGATKG